MIKTEKIYCDYIKDNVVISTKFVKVAEVQKATEKRCSKWSACDNGECCKYGKK